MTGDTGTYFDAGAYQLVVSLPQTSAPAPAAPAPTPVTPTPTPTSTSPSPPVQSPAPATNTSPQTAMRLGRVTQASLANLTFNSPSTVEFFDFQSSVSGPYQLNAPGTLIQVFNARGRLMAGHEQGERFQHPGGHVVLPEGATGKQSFRDDL